VGPTQRELGEFIHILEAEGVNVRRPAMRDFSVTCMTPHWKSKGFCLLGLPERRASRRRR
jgi:hypothetical protein